MIAINNKADCCGCSACEQVCPVKCISMESDSEGFLYPKTDEKACTGCGLCKKVCPILNSASVSSSLQKAHAAYNKNEEQRLASSSGGIFSLLAKQAIMESGLVFGAAFSNDFRKVEHISCKTLEELEKLRGSKYLQSDKQDSYKQAEHALNDGKLVLYSGTPCEIEGLKKYLREPHENLLTLDLICHGVPSPKLWSKYAVFREHEAGASISKAFFRNKYYGWRKYSLLLEFSDKTKRLEPLNKDPYMQMFLQDFCLRPSCYDCKFKKKQRESDITLADFWGSSGIVPEMDDDKGLSLVIVHSKKGESFFNRIQKNIKSKPVDFETAIKCNPPMILSAKKPLQREDFIKEMDILEIPELAKKYLKRPSLKSIAAGFAARMLPRRLKSTLKKLLGRLK